MGTIWIEGQYKSIGGSKINSDTLKNYTTKAELQKAVEDLTASIEGIDHNVEEETLIIQ